MARAAEQVGEIWLITGAQASGKSTVAERLAGTFPRGVHVRGGQFYRWVVRGWVPFDDPDRPAEARELLALRYRQSVEVAIRYAEAGFACVVQDNIYGADVTQWLDRADQAAPARLVVLRPSIAVVSDRDRARRDATGKIAYRGAFTPKINDQHLATTPPIGLWLDTSDQTPAETVAQIRARAAEALVG